MRIVVVHNRYRSAFPSGENQVVDRETALLRSAGHEVVVHERSSDEIPALSLVDKALVPARITWSRPERRRLSRMLDDVIPDVVHVHNTFPLLSPSVLAACRQKGIPVAMTLHNFRLLCANAMLIRKGEPCRRCLGRLPVAAVQYGCYRGSPVRTLPIAAMIATHRTLGTWRRLVERFVVPSEFAREVLVADGFPRRRVVVKPHFVDEPAVVRSDAGQDVLYVGRLGAEKGLGVLMDAWEQRTEPGRLVIVGDGPMREHVQSWVKRVPDATYLGWQGRRRCAELASMARCMVIPSTVEETFGLAVIEAFASGVPVIGCALGAIPELVEDGRSGWLITPGDASMLADRIDHALADRELTTLMGKHARRQYEERFSARANLALLERLYGEVVRRSPP